MQAILLQNWHQTVITTSNKHLASVHAHNVGVGWVGEVIHQPHTLVLVLEALALDGTIVAAKGVLGLCVVLFDGRSKSLTFSYAIR